MADTIKINGTNYKIKKTPDKITLQRYNEAHKMWVNLHLPTGNEEEKKRTEDDIIRILSSQYIERNSQAQSNGGNIIIVSLE